MENLYVTPQAHTINYYIGLVLLPIVVVLLVITVPLPTSVFSFILVSLPFLSYAFFSTLWTPASASTLSSWISFAQILLLASITFWLGYLGHTRLLSWSYVIGTCVILAVIFSALGSPVGTRLYITNFNPNWLSFALLSATGPIVVLMYNSQAYVRALLLCVWVGISISLIFMGSRGALVVYVFMTLAILGALRSNTTRVVFGITLATFVIFIFPMFNISTYLLERYQIFLTYQELIALSGRTDIWASAWMYPFNPIVGEGLGSFRHIVGHASHNSYLELFFEFGVIGLVLYLAPLTYLLIHAGRRGRRLKVLSPAALGFLLILTTGNWHFHKAFWIGLVFLSFLGIYRTRGLDWEMRSSR